ncbi:hypothetical protein [Halovivax gelatinilyticus]|uniref:hypothetical protein n=1 Tax=Halovivax gelatinilyticus TaxID=2961597 RepID=UPI0020CA805B|nr:hypothetical protein [Halovivax gelatinilyticus]
MTETDESRLSERDRRRLAAFAEATDLETLVQLTGAHSIDDAYFAAKAEWTDLRRRALDPPEPIDGFPGRAVEIDGHQFVVHGITHAGTDAEREYLRSIVPGLVADGAAVYCEQGIRTMYFEDVGGVCEMDDLRWAMDRADEYGGDGNLRGAPAMVADVAESATDALDDLRDRSFSSIDSARRLYGDRFARALGDVATSFLTGPTDRSTGVDFESFVRSNRAAADPVHLGNLQYYYETRLLPQPLERAWLAGHDPELSVLTHGRNERMAAYVVSHNRDADRVHAIVGAAHQPGLLYCLRSIRDGRLSIDDFDLVD